LTGFGCAVGTENEGWKKLFDARKKELTFSNGEN
jgi:hypothetical protein